VPTTILERATNQVKIQEADAKRLLLAQGLPVPAWEVARSPTEARAAASRLLHDTGKVVIKAQVLVGGRGKAGGVKLAGSDDEAEHVADEILGMQIKGITVRKVLVAAAADIIKEYYLAAVLDRAARRILLMGSAEGGVEIETVAATKPEAIVRLHADPLLGLRDWQARELAFRLGLGRHVKAAVSIARGLVATMLANDADLVEINPLAVVRGGAPGSPGGEEQLVCLDAKITLDDSGLFRHPELESMRDPDEEDPADAEARRHDISFIHLDGTIGCMVNGAGLAMTTMDLVKRAGGEPANFLDIGGGAKADRVAAAMRLILGDPKVEAILVNIFGGITRGDEVALGLIEARRQQHRDVPMVVRIVGTNAEEAARLLEEAHFATATSLDEAARKAVAAARSHAA
jgi:succinyl-CoA synthetase beta subunit